MLEIFRSFTNYTVEQLINIKSFIQRHSSTVDKINTNRYNQHKMSKVALKKSVSFENLGEDSMQPYVSSDASIRKYSIEKQYLDYQLILSIEDHEKRRDSLNSSYAEFNCVIDTLTPVKQVAKPIQQITKPQK